MFKKKSIFVFGKAQLSAFIGGISDWIIFLLCVKFGVFYTVAIWISGFLGALVNFSVNKYWTYEAKEEETSKQLFRFYFVVIGSVALKSLGTYVITEGLTIDCRLSRLVVDLIVSLGYNYTLQRYWVFKKPKFESQSYTESYSELQPYKELQEV